MSYEENQLTNISNMEEEQIRGLNDGLCMRTAGGLMHLNQSIYN